MGLRFGKVRVLMEMSDYLVGYWVLGMVACWIGVEASCYLSFGLTLWFFVLSIV